MSQREGYKKTEIGWIPEDWDVERLGNLLLEKPEYGANASAVKFDKETTYRYIRITDIDDSGKLNPNDSVGILKENNQNYVLQKHDLIIARTGNTVGKSFLYMDDNHDCAYAGYLIRFRIDQAKYNIFLLFHILHSLLFWNWVNSILRVGAQPNINAKEYQSFLIPLPPLPEQQKIASILTTVDDKISSIDQQIQQTEQLKKGLMEKLLTEGIGHTEFKDTEIGRIPKEWGVVILNQIVEENFNITYGVVQPGEDDPNGVLFIRGGDLKNGKISTNLRKISRSISHQYKRTILIGGEILVALVGYPGETVIVPSYLKGANIARQVALLKISPKVSRHYLQQYFASNLGKHELLRDIVGSAQQVINLVSLKKVKVILPPLPEQEQIASILSSVDDKIETLTQKKSEYQTLKKGLMAELLTGKRRVKV